MEVVGIEKTLRSKEVKSPQIYAGASTGIARPVWSIHSDADSSPTRTKPRVGGAGPTKAGKDYAG